MTDPVPVFHILEPPKYAGAYWVNGFAMEVKVRPRWLHRFMMRWVFGWVWVDRS